MKSLNTTIKEANDYLSTKEDVMNSKTINDAKKTEILKLIDTIKTKLEEHINKLKLKLRNMDPNSREQYLSKLPSYYDPVLAKYRAQLEKAIDPDWGTIKSVRNENNAYIQTKRDDVKKLTTISKTKFKDLMNLINEYEEESNQRIDNEDKKLQKSVEIINDPIKMKQFLWGVKAQLSAGIRPRFESTLRNKRWAEEIEKPETTGVIDADPLNEELVIELPESIEEISPADSIKEISPADSIKEISKKAAEKSLEQSLEIINESAEKPETATAVIEADPVVKEPVIESTDEKKPIIEKKLSSSNTVYLNTKISGDVEMNKVHKNFDSILSKAANKEEVFDKLVKTVLMYEKISI